MSLSHQKKASEVPRAPWPWANPAGGLCLTADGHAARPAWPSRGQLEPDPGGRRRRRRRRALRGLRAAGAVSGTHAVRLPSERSRHSRGGDEGRQVIGLCWRRAVQRGRLYRQQLQQHECQVARPAVPPLVQQARQLQQQRHGRGHPRRRPCPLAARLAQRCRGGCRASCRLCVCGCHDCCCLLQKESWGGGRWQVDRRAALAASAATAAVAAAAHASRSAGQRQLQRCRRSALRRRQLQRSRHGRVPQRHRQARRLAHAARRGSHPARLLFVTRAAGAEGRHGQQAGAAHGAAGRDHHCGGGAGHGKAEGVRLSSVHAGRLGAARLGLQPSRP